MIEEKHKYSFYQNVQIMATEMYNDAGLKLANNGSLADFLTNDTFNFNVSVNAPNSTNVKKIVIKNIASSLNTATGYSYELRADNGFLRYPV